MATVINGRESGFKTNPRYKVALEPSPRRVRVKFAGEVIADSTDAHLLFETRHVPVYYFPRQDVRMGLLVGTAHHTFCPYKGEASYWTIRVGDRVSENAVWGYPEPYDEVPELKDFVAFYWERVDHWYEEDEEVFVHARDPHKRVDVVASSRRIQVLLGGVVVADTSQAQFLFETGLPTRYYIPPEDVRTDLLIPSEKATACPYKGKARYWSVKIGDRTFEDIVWSYPEPIPECPKIKDLLCFFNEHVDDIRLDGVSIPRPITPWSKDWKEKRQPYPIRAARSRGRNRRTMTTRALADPILMEVFSNRLLSITEEMGSNLIRASFSTNIKERRDCSVGLFDAGGRLIVQAAHIPLHLGSLLGAVETVLRDYPLADMREGDAFICNDPYLAAGTHMPDISVVTPVFWAGENAPEPRFFTANIGHHSDVGGRVPGSIAADAMSVFEEGIRIPATRVRHAGVLDKGMMRLIAENTREPEERTLDLQAQIAANDLGARRIKEMAVQVGIDAVATAIDDILAYTAQRLRNRIAGLAAGAYSFTTYLDDDGGGKEKVPLTVTVRVSEQRLDFDFTGSASQSKGALNVPESGLKATVFYAVKALLDPGLLPNSGLFEALTITAPEGSIVNPHFPAAVGARSITCQRVAGAIFGAFRGLLPPDKVMASSNDVLPAIVFSGQHRRHKRTYVYLETLGGGAGARLDRDGMDGVQVHVTNTSNLPIEALENEYPLLVEEYGLVAGSGGVGRARGGLGIARQIRALDDDTVFGCRSDSHLTRAEGVFGGEAGAPGRLVRNPGRNNAENLPSKVSRLVLNAGESMRIETPGGGGAGNPDGRHPEQVKADIHDGKVAAV